MPPSEILRTIGQAGKELLDPVIVAMKGDDNHVRQAFSGLTERDLRKVIIGNNLADSSELEGLTSDQMLDLLVSSARLAKEARD